jgi:hypothetical protein
MELRNGERCHASRPRYLVPVGKGRRQDAPPQTDAAPASAPEPASPQRDAASETHVASHELLFAAPGEVRCDACGSPVARDDDEVYGVPGEGVYLWARGDEVRFERAPLCASCASAIGMTALARWEIEEEEG